MIVNAVGYSDSLLYKVRGRCSAFYECGFAVAMNKEVIILTDSYENLTFDIRNRNAISYGNDFKKLMSPLNIKLNSLTHIQSQ